MEELSPIFEGVEDPRRSNAARHDLVKMLTIGLLSTLRGGHPSGHPSLKAIALGEGEARAYSIISTGRPAPQASAGVRTAKAEYAGRARQRGRFRIGLSLEKPSAPELLHRWAFWHEKQGRKSHRRFRERMGFVHAGRDFRRGVREFLR